MSYYFAKTLTGTDFDAAVNRVTEVLKEHGFGVLTQIDVKATMKQKLDADFHDYLILGACNPQMAHQALTHENKIGTMLPCNVVVQTTDDGIEVAAVDPVASMQAIDNPELGEVAQKVREMLRETIEAL
jgi:uncharacterized protein (DUF302 family)